MMMGNIDFCKERLKSVDRGLERTGAPSLSSLGAFYLLSLLYVNGNANNVVFVVIKQYTVRKGEGVTFKDYKLMSNVSCSGYNARGQST